MRITKLLTGGFASAIVLLGLNINTSSAADPIVPPTPESKADVNVQPNPGGLQLLNIPTFETGTVTLGENANTMELKAEGPLQVSDLRGSGAGWNLAVKRTVFKEIKTDGSASIKSFKAIVQLGNGTGLLPNSETGGVNGVEKMNIRNGIDVPIDQDADLVTSGVGVGMGVADITYLDSKITIPTDSLIGSYESTMTWTLENTPPLSILPGS